MALSHQDYLLGYFKFKFKFWVSEIWAQFSKILAKLVDFTQEKTHFSSDSFLFNTLLFGPFSYQGFFFPQVLISKNW
jgi:hypothetical protein